MRQVPPRSSPGSGNKGGTSAASGDPDGAGTSSRLGPGHEMTFNFPNGGGARLARCKCPRALAQEHQAKAYGQVSRGGRGALGDESGLQAVEDGLEAELEPGVAGEHRVQVSGHIRGGRTPVHGGQVWQRDLVPGLVAGEGTARLIHPRPEPRGRGSRPGRPAVQPSSDDLR